MFIAAAIEKESTSTLTFSGQLQAVAVSSPGGCKAVADERHGTAMLTLLRHPVEARGHVRCAWFGGRLLRGLVACPSTPELGARSCGIVFVDDMVTRSTGASPSATAIDLEIRRGGRAVPGFDRTNGPSVVGVRIVAAGTSGSSCRRQQLVRSGRVCRIRRQGSADDLSLVSSCSAGGTLIRNDPAAEQRRRQRSSEGGRTSGPRIVGNARHAGQRQGMPLRFRHSQRTRCDVSRLPGTYERRKPDDESPVRTEGIEALSRQRDLAPQDADRAQTPRIARGRPRSGGPSRDDSPSPGRFDKYLGPVK